MNPKERFAARPLEWEELSYLYLDLLKGYKPVFRQMRSRFQVNSSVGFASFYLFHQDAPAFVVAAKKGPKELLMFQEADPEKDEPDPYLGELTHKQKKQLLVEPDLRAFPGSIISLGIPKFQYDLNPELITTLLADEKVIRGLLAHELSHCLGKLPPHVQSKFAAICSKYISPNPDSYYQATTDLAAGYYGYPTDVYAALTAWEEIVKATTPDDRKKLAEFRYRKQVLRDWR